MSGSKDDDDMENIEDDAIDVENEGMLEPDSSDAEIKAQNQNMGDTVIVEECDDAQNERWD